MIETSVWPGGFLGFWFSFSSGVLVCWGTLQGGFARGLAAVFCMALAVIGYVNSSGLTGIVALTGLLMIIADRLGSMNTWLNWRCLQWLAMISYSLYLLHNPLTGMSFRFVQLLSMSGIVEDVIGCVVALIFCFMGSHIAFLIIEKPSIRWSHTMSVKKPIPY